MSWLYFTSCGFQEQDLGSFSPYSLASLGPTQVPRSVYRVNGEWMHGEMEKRKKGRTEGRIDGLDRL